ncbi:hypothetical protein [Pseudanabaena sp. FACHB-2040]|uniref:hypothetical protein n=1 Tax=Pseudanabaena sp. FACHB-2040 TaxID=2692859 RepID=UPI00168A2BD4|nr:hypothetical protein [Pseudanabaena sp. FACHB-2040]MBD2260267.1 hypothetical protein [Pseudanabaena sp. FACHB-2040]
MAPLFITSIALHAILLAFPLSSPQTAVEPEEAEEEEPAVIDILGIARPELVEPEPIETAPPPSAETPPATAQPAPSPAAAAPANPDTLPPPEDNPVDDPPAVDDPFQAPPADEPPATPAFDPQASRQQFFANLPNIGVSDYTGTIGLPDRRRFRNPSSADRFLANVDHTPTALPNTTARWLDKEPGTILRDGLQAAYEASGLSFVEQEAFVEERFFEAQNAEGQTVFYISLVQLEGSTLLVMWDNDPR